MKTNEQIFEEIKTRGYISEQQISLLKRRGNHQDEDIFDYSLLDTKQFSDGNYTSLSFSCDRSHRKNCPFFCFVPRAESSDDCRSQRSRAILKTYSAHCILCGRVLLFAFAVPFQKFFRRLSPLVCYANSSRIR